MILKYNKSQSSVYPDLVDTTSSSETVYLRKNVIKKEISIEDRVSEIYEYDEAKLTKEEYKEYLNQLNIIDIQQQRADIDYIAFMTGIDLQAGDNNE